jgi:hypothetical protein
MVEWSMGHGRAMGCTQILAYDADGHRLAAEEAAAIYPPGRLQR